MKKTIASVLREAIRCLEEGGISEARATAEILLADMLAMPRLQLYLEAHTILSIPQQDTYKADLGRRLRGEPLQYIMGQQEFYAIEFEVSPAVLIPRPESELLVEQGVHFLRQWQAEHPQLPLYLLDVGTGSGNLAISLATVLPESRVWAIDIAPEALRVAQRNARRVGVADRLVWICGDLVTSLRDAACRFALCVSNLPYVSTAEWQSLPREIKAYEPPTALRGGEDGLELIRRLIVAGADVLAEGGRLLLEVGWQQAGAVLECIRQQGRFQSAGTHEDFAGIERVIWAQVP